MNKGEIQIGDKMHPIRFTMGAIENIFVSLDIADFGQLAEKLDNKTIGKALTSVKVIAFEGVAAGYKHLAAPCPFKNADELGEAVTKFSQLTPCLTIFNQAVSDFFYSEDEIAGEVIAAGEESR